MDITALLIAAIASYVIGAVWYSALFGRMWRQLLGIPENASKAGLGKAMAIGFLLELVRAYVLIKVVAAMGAYSVVTGMEVGFWVWLGFVATIGVQQMIYERRSWKLFAITYAYHLVTLLVMGAVVAVW